MEARLPNALLYSLAAAFTRPGTSPLDEQHLYSVLGREAVDAGFLSPAYKVHGLLKPALDAWGHRFLSSVSPSGSFAKGTANRSGTDIDLFISLSEDTPDTLENIHKTLANQMKLRGYIPRLQNVSIGLNVGSLKVDLVPARRQGWLTGDHSLYHRKSQSWRKTDVSKHIDLVRNSGRQSEIRLLKIWRDQRGIDFPSFYIELVVMRALKSSWNINIASCMLSVLDYLSQDFIGDRYIDPANTNNVISDDLSLQQKRTIQQHAQLSLTQPWSSFAR